MHPVVADVRRRHGGEEDVALDAADLPVVLVLEVVAVGEAVQICTATVFSPGRSRSVTSNSAGVLLPFAKPASRPFTHTKPADLRLPKCRMTRRPRQASGTVKLRR